MLELTFGEQVKIVLGRKNMTIKQLAVEIEKTTGMKMSRQNLTQRLGRDNFQEQDMRMIAEILGCPFQLSILEIGEQKRVKHVEESPVVADVEVEPQVEEVVEITEEFIPVKEIIKKPAIEIVEPDISENQREVTIEEIEPKVVDVPMDSEKGDVNPYTGYEYKTNSVRTHPTRIGYVQVYDRRDHTWTDMTEWAFLGYQERQKLSLGKSYQEPTYLD